MLLSTSEAKLIKSLAIDIAAYFQERQQGPSRYRLKNCIADIFPAEPWARDVSISRLRPALSALSPRRRFLLVHNPIAGLANRPLLGDVLRALEARGAEIVITSQKPADALADPQGLDAVIAAGGDGTIRALAAVAGDLPVGIVPCGTGNVLACEIGLPLKDAARIAEVLLQGRAETITGGLANGEPFYLMAGAGFDGEIVSRLSTPLKRRIGKVAYTGPVLRALTMRPQRLEVTIDGVRYRARWAIATNGRLYGGAFVLAPDANLLERGFDVVMMKGGFSASLAQLISLGLGRLSKAPGVEIVRGHEITITSSNPCASQIDGDPFVPLPLRITSAGPSFRLLVPESYSSR